MLDLLKHSTFLSVELELKRSLALEHRSEGRSSMERDNRASEARDPSLLKQARAVIFSDNPDTLPSPPFLEN